jgi:tRNA pseudouridine32 synthase/23S rRNA pseudouridine746 synthase
LPSRCLLSRQPLAVPFDIPMLYRGDDLVVVDKPHFLATMPRGGHVAQTALVCLRRDLDRTDAPTNRGCRWRRWG